MIHSSSDGSTVDIEPPSIVLTTVGLHGINNDTEHTQPLNTQQTQPLYQAQYDSIDLRWNATDQTSDVSNVTWMAGSLPLSDDIHEETQTQDYEARLSILV